MTDYASREWLLGFISDNRQEAARLAKNPSPQVERARKQAKQERTKPWPRRNGYTSASGAQLMWRP